MLLAVLCIWSLLGYKIISALNPAQPESPSQQLKADFKQKPIVENDTFSIEPVLRDPFLGTIQTKVPPPIIKSNIKPVPLEWPRLSYGGMVKNQNTNARVFVLNINDVQYLLKKGQRVDDLTIMRGTPKEVVVRYKNEQRIIPFQE